MMVGSVLAMAAGVGMLAYALNNKKTKQKATKLINNAMDVANKKIEDMK